jgi:hypothetical protein
VYQKNVLLVSVVGKSAAKSSTSRGPRITGVDFVRKAVIDHSDRHRQGRWFSCRSQWVHLPPIFLPEAGWLIRFGILLWYTTFGAIIGVFGVFTWHPVLKLPMPWWIRDPVLGAWLNFVLTFFAYDTMQAMMMSLFGPGGMLASPFWFAAEGAVVGLLIGYFATRFGGEGAETAGK